MISLLKERFRSAPAAPAEWAEQISEQTPETSREPEEHMGCVA